jgi:DNA-binding CsgD family transcriptional regulator
VLLATGNVMSLARPDKFSNAAKTPLFELSSAVLLVGGFALLLALAGMQARQGDRAGRFGLPTAPTADFPELTDREHEILQLIAGGHNKQDIARRLVLSHGTVRNYVSSIFGKLHVTDRANAIVRARQAGYGTPTRPDQLGDIHRTLMRAPADHRGAGTSRPAYGGGLSARPDDTFGQHTRSPRPAE